jgi:hypothetical protein
MQNTSVGGTGTGTGTTGATEGGGEMPGAGTGNDQLQAAFNTAITQAQRTLTITTVMGADLYALKQRAQ